MHCSAANRTETHDPGASSRVSEPLRGALLSKYQLLTLVVQTLFRGSLAQRRRCGVFRLACRILVVSKRSRIAPLEIPGKPVRPSWSVSNHALLVATRTRELHDVRIT